MTLYPERVSKEFILASRHDECDPKAECVKQWARAWIKARHTHRIEWEPLPYESRMLEEALRDWLAEE